MTTDEVLARIADGVRGENDSDAILVPVADLRVILDALSTPPADDVRGAATPVTTSFVRRHYSMGPTAYKADGSVAQMPSAADVEYAGCQFDEWLARHDAEVRESLTPRPTGLCLERYPDPSDDVQCWLTGLHLGKKEKGILV